MKRREAIKNTFLVVGSAGFIGSTGLLGSCKPSLKDDWVPQFFTMDQINLISELAETILPRTETPGAKDAMVERYLDEYTQRFLKVEQQQQFQQALGIFEQIATNLNNKSFVNSSEEERTAVFNKMIGDNEGGELSPDAIFHQFRGLVNRAFFTSEVGATQVLEHQPIPGNYLGDVPLSDTKGVVYSG